MKSVFLRAVATLTRRFHPPGTDRLLTLLHNPNKRQNFSVRSVSPCNEFKINTDTASYIEWQVFFRGDYEPLTTEIVRKYVGSDSISIDVGANVGVHSLTMSQGRKVYAFEPEPSIARKLKANVELNGLKNVEIIEAALSDVDGSLTLYSADDKSNPNEGQASLIPGHFEGRTKEVKVKVTTLDSMFRDLGRLDFVKIDTEGNDMRVLLGGEKTISRLRPTIIFEWHEPSWKKAGTSIEDAICFFEKLDYSLSNIDKGAPLALPITDFANILAISNPR